jgi:hypothetical protein
VWNPTTRIFTVGNDTVYRFSHSGSVSLSMAVELVKLTVDQAEFVGCVASVRVTVERAGFSVSRPTGVSHRGLGDESLSHVDDADVSRLLGVRRSGLVGGLIGIRGVLRN